MAGYDPRRHSAVALSVRERQPVYLGAKGDETPMKSYVVGPNRPDPLGVDSLRRPVTAPARSGAQVFSIAKKNSDAHPKFISPDGKWVQEQLPTLIADSQAQPLTATATLSTTIPGKYGQEQEVRPVTNVHTYNDISPVATGEYVKDGDVQIDPLASMRNAPVMGNSAHTLRKGAKMESSPYTERTAIGDPQLRTSSINGFWNRLNGSYNLGIQDLDRFQELGKNVVPGTPNCRLVGSRWRYIGRPVEGDVVYTDYYGRYATEHCNYYGRRYEVGTNQFNQNRLVSDSDYVKVQASMQGIHSLRTRPGLSLHAAVVSGPSEKLEKLSPYAVSSARGVHRIQEYARMRPATSR
mmetsp:Transcript_39050/g.86868  ORF Transcript_39050/g.86868 Transcript_39050/m.86868 type:complete len:352 (-) Transcript_39050:710-1765(-)